MSSLPLKLLDECIGSQIWVVMSDEIEIAGKLLGFDEYVNVVLADAVEYASGKQTSHKKLLVHGRNVAMLIPGAIKSGAPVAA